LATPCPPVGLGDGAVTCECRERHDGDISQKEPYFVPLICRIVHGEVEVGIDSVPEFDIDVHTTENHRLHGRALVEPDAKEVVAHIKLGVNPM
jgi:hypothetical protein